jgi:hypothetical protein
VDSQQPELAEASRQETVAVWEATIKLEASPRYHYQLARFYAESLSQLDQDKSAILLAHATASAEGMPSSADSRNLLALAKVMDGAVDDAELALAQAKKLRIAPHADDAVVAAAVLASQGRADEAKESLQEARQWLAVQQPGNDRLRDFIGEVERYLNRPR